VRHGRSRDLPQGRRRVGEGGGTTSRVGDYLLSNDDAGDDAYAVERARFEAMYTPV